MTEKVRQRKFTKRNKAIFRNKIGEEINGLKIVGYVEGRTAERVFECNVCKNHFTAQISNVRCGTWHCGCLQEIINNTKQKVFEYRNLE